MAEGLWVRTIKHHKIDRSIVEPCGRDNPQEALDEACRKLDLSRPMWLSRHQRDWDSFGQTRFLPDNFIDSVDFERMEIEFIDPDAPKRSSRDPRNAF